MALPAMNDLIRCKVPISRQRSAKGTQTPSYCTPKALRRNARTFGSKTRHRAETKDTGKVSAEDTDSLLYDFSANQRVRHSRLTQLTIGFTIGGERLHPQGRRSNEEFDEHSFFSRDPITLELHRTDCHIPRQGEPSRDTVQGDTLKTEPSLIKLAAEKIDQ